MTSSVVGLRRNCIVHPKVKLATKKGRGHCLVVCCLSDPLQLSESCWNHYIWEVCSAYQWDAPKTSALIVSSGQQNGHSSFPRQHPTSSRTTNTSKVKWMGYKVLPHLPYSFDLSLTNYHFSKHLDNFMQEKCLHNQKMLSKNCSNPEAQTFMLQE